MGYLRPTDGRTLCSRDCHRGRTPPSQEAGTDIWSEFGTPLRAADAGRVVEVGGSIYAATGYFVTIDLDDGRRIRYLHLWDRYVRPGDRVSRGTVFAQSGGSGYGSLTAAGGEGTVGRHVHVTLWPSHAYDFGTNARTLDFEQFADPIGSTASTTSQPFEEDDMPLTQQDLSAILDAEFQVTQRGQTRAVKLKDALGAVFTVGDILADRIDGVPQNVWGHRLVHPLATVDGKPASIPAGDFIRYEPAEHANTRAAVAAVATGDVDVDKLAAEIAARYPQIDVHALAVAAADEADRRDAEEARRREADRAARDAAGS